MGRVLMDKTSPPFNLLAVKLGHELIMSDTLSKLLDLARAIRDERLELAKRHAGRASNEN